MNGTSKLEPRRTWQAGLLALLVGGLAVNCSSKSDNSTMLNIGGGSLGGAANGGASGAATAGASTGGSGGASTGMPPSASGMCVTSATKHADGLCYCQPSTLTYCSDACTDPQIDPDHCGNCTTKCGDTQGCSAGKCGTAPTALVPAAAGCGAIRLIIAGDTVYWTDETKGTVSSIPLAGGTAKVIATGEMTPTTLAVSGTNVYWLATGSKSIRKKATDGSGTASDVVASSIVTTACTGVDAAKNCGLGGFTVTATGDVYYAIYTNIYKLTGGTGTAVKIGHEDSGIPRAIAVEGALIGYPTDTNQDVDVISEVMGTDAYCKTEVNTDNTNCVRIARSQGSLFYDNVYLVNKVLYWVDGAQVHSNSATDNTTGNKTITSADASLAGFALAGTNAVFADTSDAGLIYKAPLVPPEGATDTKVLLARKQVGVTSVAADATHAVWANADCSINTLGL